MFILHLDTKDWIFKRGKAIRQIGTWLGWGNVKNIKNVLLFSKITSAKAFQIRLFQRPHDYSQDSWKAITHAAD